ncbi:hypothetical protein M885DRAFT_597661 [Pelagophyceae sp. CCMP2097]|nr:hypothetical protein M885DRAFT_597661 [Pelagophyceae sp. CCMP2097]
MLRTQEPRKRRTAAPLGGYFAGVCISFAYLVVSVRQWQRHQVDLDAALQRASGAQRRLDDELVTQQRLREQLRQLRQSQPQHQPPQPRRLPWWRVAADCSAYDVNCPTNNRDRYAAYPLEDVPEDVKGLPLLVNDELPPVGADELPPVRADNASHGRLRRALASAARTSAAPAPLSVWWRSVTAPDASAVATAAQPRRAALMLNETTPWEARLRAVLPPPSAFDKSTFIKGCVAWTMTDKSYGEAMLHDVVDMAATTAGFGDRFFIVALDRETLRAAAAGGLRAVGAPGFDAALAGVPDRVKEHGAASERLRAVVQQSKYFISHWLVAHDVDFFFFEMDVWFVASAQRIVEALQRSKTVQAIREDVAASAWPHRAERGIVGPLQLVVAAAQNNPIASNIGVFAVVASDATREFFADWLEEARTRAGEHDQKLFHNLLSLARFTADGAPDKAWKGRPLVPPPTLPLFHAFIPVHVGACSILPVPTERTVFLHTLGNTPLKSQHGKQLHAKELAAWHGLGAPTSCGAQLPTYYGPGAHDGRTKYVALDEALTGAVSLCEERNPRFLRAKIALLVLVVVDFHAFFTWTVLDLASVVPLTQGWRETNFMSTKRAWHNATAPFRSVAGLNLEADAVGVYRQDERGNEIAQWYRLRRNANHATGAAPPPSGSSAWQSVQLDELAAALALAGDEELLLINPSFVGAEFVSVLSGCAAGNQPDGPTCSSQGLPSAFAAVYYRLKWCSTRGWWWNLDRHVSKTFQDFDCFNSGHAEGPHQRELDDIALRRLGE